MTSRIGIQRDPASKKQEATVTGLIALFAAFIGAEAEKRVPGSGEFTVALVVALGAVIASKIRDWVAS